MAKMFYSASEAADKLGKSEEELTDLVKQGTLREFRDGGQVHYKVEDVDALAGPGASATGEIVLEPAEDSGIELSPSSSDVLSLGDVDADDTAVGVDAGTKKKKKGDTVVPSVGVNVFDDDELDEVVDPLAQTAVTDVAGLGVEGIGSGSGILDLTRESDDTSLGAELLDEIYAGDEGGTVEMGEDTRAGLDDAIPELPDTGPAGFADAEAEPIGAVASGAPVAAPTMRRVAEVQGDAASAGMTAVLFVSLLVMLFAGLGAASLVRGVEPGILKAIYSNLPIYAAGASGVAVIAGVVTFLLGKRSAG